MSKLMYKRHSFKESSKDRSSYENIDLYIFLNEARL